MVRLPFRALALTSVLLGSAAFQIPDQPLAAARRVAAAYVEADTTGRWRTADSLVDWRHCDFDPATDFVQPTLSARVTKAVMHRDTVDVTVEYVVLGRAWSLATRRAGEKNWRFTAGRSTQRVVLHVVPDSRRRAMIACGEYQANHVGLSHLREAVAQMDDASRAALERARLNRAGSAPR